MISAAILCPDSDLRDQFDTALARPPGVYVSRRLSYYPDDGELTRFLQAHAPELVFLSVEAPGRALEIARLAARLSAGIEIVAIARRQDEEILLSLMNAGARNLLSAPFDPALVAQSVQQAAERIATRRAAAPAGQVYSFLPAKPGSGTSVLALNASLALARSTGAPTLLIDFDFNLGVVGALLGMPAGTTVFDAATHTSAIDDPRWTCRIAVRDGLHLLPSAGLDLGMRIDIAQVSHLIGLSRRSYSNVCIDLSGNMEAYAVEALRESRRIVLVTSLDPLAAYLAGKKLALLSRLDLTDRVLTVATRTTERDWWPVRRLEKLIGRRIDLVVPHDRTGLRAAIEAREPAAPRSRVGTSAAALARELAGSRGSRPLSRLKRSFFDYFSLAHSR